ncbi:MAG: helix-turn-helix transcriptional regulator [Methanosarcinaceae archaeon]|nr:helix-turn-helix transcriptional regulator [Methanosarcinaceae archaeon]
MTRDISVAERIRDIRESCEMTAEEAAERIHVDADLYKRFESGEEDIPISALYEIAGLFGVDLTDLLTGVSPRLETFSVVRKNEGHEIERCPGYSFRSMAYNFKNRKIEPLIVDLDPVENKKMKLISHPGQEFNLILEGKVRVIVGENSADLEEGDTAYFDATIPHGQAVIGDEKAKFLTVIFHGTDYTIKEDE